MSPQDEILRELIRRMDKAEHDIDVLRSQQLYPLQTSISTLRSITLGSDGGGTAGSTIVDIFSASALNIPAGLITRMRITFQAAAAESFTITNAYIGHAAITGNAYDFLSTPTQITFLSGSASSVVPAGGTSVSDLLQFSYNKSNALVIAIYANGGAGSDAPKYTDGLSNINEYHRGATNEAGTVLKTAGYTLVSGRDIAVSLIESNGF